MGYKHNFHYSKFDLIDLDINGSISEAVQFINENNVTCVALATNEKSQLQGIVDTHDILAFLLNNYKGDVDFFLHAFNKFENKSNISHCAKN